MTLIRSSNLITLIALSATVVTLAVASPAFAAENALGYITNLVQCHRANDGDRVTLVTVSNGSETRVIQVDAVEKNGDPDPRGGNLAVALAAYLSGKKVWINYHSSPKTGDSTCNIPRDGYIHIQENNFFMILDE